jgi:hypothetical protein
MNLNEPVAPIGETSAAPVVSTKPQRKRAKLCAVRGNHAISANIDPQSREAAHKAALMALEVFGVNANSSLSYRAGARLLLKHLKEVAKKIQALPEGDERRAVLIERERNLLVVAGAAGARE